MKISCNLRRKEGGAFGSRLAGGGNSDDGNGKWKSKGKEAFKDGGSAHTKPRKFTFLELAIATEKFNEKHLLGSGGFGRVYRGQLESTNEIVAVKMLDHNGIQGNKEFIVEALMLQLLNHSNVVKLIGYCDEQDQRLLVYEYMALGSLEQHLYAFGMATRKRALDWSRRMNIAAGAAKGLEYLHDKASPPVIYRDLKCSNILLDEKYNPKLSDFGLAKFGPAGNRTHVSSRLMGTMGYVAPDVASSGQLTFQADVYSFGVVLLELITGRRAVDESETPPELVIWAQTYFNDRTRFTEMADPLLQGQYSTRSLYHAIAVAVICLHDNAAQRPPIADVVTCLSYLASKKFDPSGPSHS